MCPAPLDTGCRDGYSPQAARAGFPEATRRREPGTMCTVYYTGKVVSALGTTTISTEHLLGTEAG